MDMLAELTQEQLDELVNRLWRGWHRAREVHDDAYYASRDNNTRAFVNDLERTYMPVVNEYWGRQLGCRWQACTVCRHESCGFCPTCNPGAIAPNGQAYDDAEDTPDACC